MRGRGFYERLAVASFLLIPAAYLILGIGLVVFGNRPPDGVLRQLAAISAASVAAALLVVWSSRLLAAAIVIGVLVLFAGAGPTSSALAHPDSFFDFMTSVVTVVGALVAFVSSCIAVAQRLRGTTRNSKPAELKLIRIAPALLVAAAVFSAGVTSLHRPRGAAPPGATIVELQVDKFIPSKIRLRAGERARFFVMNHDSYAHTFTIDSLGVDSYVGPRDGRLIEFDVPAGRRGRFELSCTVVGHGNMRGTINVR